jgi:hypothetical protein
MDEADMSSDTFQLSMSVEEERLFASFSRRLIEKAVAACRSGIGAFVVNMLERMCLPAIVLDRHGFVLELNATARAVLDPDINIKDNRLCVRDREAYGHLKVSLDEMTKPVQLKSLAAEPILIRRRDKFPVVLRTVPFKEPTQSSEQQVHALVTLTACRRDPGHPQRSSPRIFVV